MSKGKAKSRSQHARSPKTAAKVQRASQVVIRSPKEGRPREVAEGSTESPPQCRQEARLSANPMAVFQDDIKQTMKDIISSKGFDFPSVPGNVRAYQAKLAEVAQANVQFAFEYAQRLATSKSPVEILYVVAEFTSKRIAMFQRHLIEMAELSTKQ